jgi:uncharacterized RDD family membrane protein YckC
MSRGYELSPRVLSDQTFLEIPENVRLGFRLAGPGTRLGAYLLDLGARSVALYVIVAVLSIALLPFAATGLPTGVYLVAAFFLEWGYGCFFETWWNGQTPGKRVFGLRVIKTEGYAIGFYEAMIRNLLRAADFVPLFYAAGFLTVMGNPRLQRIGDLVAGTMVVRERKPSLGGELEGLSDYSPFPPEAFRHRYRPSEKTLEIIESLFRRRFDLAPARLDEIASILAEPLGKRLDSFSDRKIAREQPAEFLFRLLSAHRAFVENALGPERGPAEGAARQRASRPAPSFS